MAFGKKEETNEIKLHEFNIWLILLRQFKNPLLLIFVISTIVAFALGQNIEAVVIWIIMVISVFLGFWNEFQAEKVVHDLYKKILFSATIIRDGVKEIVPVRDIRIGDIVVLYPGAIVPADVQITQSQNLEINESILTGESLPVAKKDGEAGFMGTNVVSGMGQGKVTEIGTDTKFGKISLTIAKVRPETEFQKGLRDFSVMLTKVAAITVIFVIAFGFVLGHPAVETILFALTIAMGITPELLPLIVTVSLAYGAKKLARNSVIVKQFVSIEDLGNMEVLCTDKTGTLTEGKISLSSFENIKGEKDDKVLDLALIANSAVVQRNIFGDAIDKAIWEYAESTNYRVKKDFKRVYEAPFDYENRFMSTVINENGKNLLIVKGSSESILARSRISSSQKVRLITKIQGIQKQGMRVIGVATKEMKEIKEDSVSSAKYLNFEGILTFSDIAKRDVFEALTSFKNLGVTIKILTGDNEFVTQKICKDVGFTFKKVILGSEVEKLSDSDLEKVVWEADIFAKVTPIQKNRIIQALKKGNHTVGYMGDGINDGPALRSADVGISVNSGVDIAKDAASVVLLRKNLSVIAAGIKEGRRTFNNTIKYILMGTSSNFGNMFSAAGASIVLPFLPMMPVQVLLTDILYDATQLVIPTDNVDFEQLARPKRWNLDYIKRFMLFFGPISSIYDFLTFGIMYFIFQARGSLFQTGWFVESLVTEIMVVMVIRTQKFPFFRSKPSLPLLLTSFGVILFGAILPFSPLARYFGFTPLPAIFFIFLIILTLTYLVLVELGKLYLNKRVAAI